MLKNKRVLVFGTFDYLHPGHLFLLNEAVKQGDDLFVVVARDNNVKRIKGIQPTHNEQERVAAIQELDYVTDVRLGYEEWGMHLQVLEDIEPDVIVLGYDQKARIPDGDWEIIRVEAFEPEKYKSSLLRNT